MAHSDASAARRLALSSALRRDAQQVAATAHLMTCAPTPRAPCRDVIDAHDSVAVVIYHTERRALLLVRQFRPALYAGLLRAAAHAAAGDGADEKSEAVAPPLAEGFTCELCAGIVDKGLTLAEIAAEEVLEETGYRVEAAALVELTAFAASVGVQGSRQTLFFVSVDEGVRESRGGGVAGDGERIELLALPLASVEAFVMDASVPKTSGAMFGLLWAKAHVLAGDDAR